MTVPPSGGAPIGSGGGLFGGWVAPQDMAQYALMRLLLGRSMATEFMGQQLQARRAQAFGAGLKEIDQLAESGHLDQALGKIFDLAQGATSDGELALLQRKRDELVRRTNYGELARSLSTASTMENQGKFGEAANWLTNRLGMFTDKDAIARIQAVIDQLQKRAGNAEQSGALLESLGGLKRDAPDAEFIAPSPPLIQFLNLAKARGLDVSPDTLTKIKGLLTPQTDVREAGGELVGVHTNPITGQQTVSTLRGKDTQGLDPTKDERFRIGASLLAAEKGVGPREILSDPKLVAEAYRRGQAQPFSAEQAAVAKSLGIPATHWGEVNQREATLILEKQQDLDRTKAVNAALAQNQALARLPLIVVQKGELNGTPRSRATGEEVPMATAQDVADNKVKILSPKQEEAFNDIQVVRPQVERVREIMQKILANAPGENIPNGLRLLVQKNLASDADVRVFTALRDALGVKLGAIYNRGRPTEPDAQKFAALMGSVWDTKVTGTALADALLDLLNDEQAVLLGKKPATIRTPEDVARRLGVSPEELAALVIARRRKAGQ